MQTTVIQLSFPVSLFRPSQQRNKSISNFSKGHFNMAYELCVSFMYRKKKNKFEQFPHTSGDMVGSHNDCK